MILFLFVLIALLIVGLTVYALSDKLKIRSYSLRSEKLTEKLRIVLITDLHSSSYGEGQKELVDAVRNASPDMIAFTGDIVDDRIPHDNAIILAEALGNSYPCYLVTGNHEVYTHKPEKVKKDLQSCGIRILQGEGETFTHGKDTILICGIDDPFDAPDKEGRYFEDQLTDCNAMIDENQFALLLSHRPERVSYYTETKFDLILSGHAHGGQVIIPGLINGLYAPHQGIFPKYAGGKYTLDNGTVLIVGRGLSKYVRPRIFNRPELVIIDLVPAV